MTTREQIIHLTDHLVRDRGFNAFSFYDIARELNIKNASIHYYFPTKTDLGVALLEEHERRLARLIHTSQEKSPRAKMEDFLSIYDTVHRHRKVCIMGALATDLRTVDPALANAARTLAANILAWVTSILKEGLTDGSFEFRETPHTKALLIISSMMASVQLARVTNTNDFTQIRSAVIRSLTTKPAITKSASKQKTKKK